MQEQEIVHHQAACAGGARGSCAQRGWRGWAVVLLLINTLVAAVLAFSCRDNAHPDEFLHLDACRYFETHAWPPPVGSGQVVYDRDGWSRVYSGELVYWIYGKAGRVIQAIVPVARPYVLYRLMNVALLALALSVLLLARPGGLSLAPLGLVFLVIPQVTYVYSYINSDAWSLTLAVLLLALGLRLDGKSPGAWSWLEVLALGTLTGLMLAAKENFILFTLVLPYVLLMRRLWRERGKHPKGLALRGRTLGFAALWLAPLLLIPAPLRIVYPLQQSGGLKAHRAALIRMQDQKADPAFKPSQALSPDYAMAAKGKTYLDLLKSPRWVKLSVASFYGGYGWMNVWNPMWVYGLAVLGAAACLGLTVYSWRRWGHQLPYVLKLALWLSPPLLLLNVCASMHFSLNVGFQPQGRYLFPTLLSLALLLAGTTCVEPPRLKRLRAVLFVLFYTLAIGSLLLVAYPALS